MEQDALSLFDWIVIGVVLLSGVLALFRGFVREVLSLMTWVISAFVTFYFYNDVKAFLEPHISSDLIRFLLSSVGLFVGLLLIFALINSVIIRFINQGSDGSLVDSVLGGVFGVARGIFIVSLAYMMMSTVLPKDDHPEWLKQSRTEPVIAWGADVIGKVAPNYVDDMDEMKDKAKDNKIINDIKKAHKKENKSKTYSKNNRKEFERLIDAVEREGELNEEFQ